MAPTQNALPGQSGTATADELLANNNPFTITDPNALVWTISDPNSTVVATGDGTPTAKVTIGANTPPGTYDVSFSDPAESSITVTAGTVVVGQLQPTTGSVDLGPFA